MFGNLASLGGIKGLGVAYNRSRTGIPGLASVEIIERWVSIASWTPSNANQVSGGRLYASTTDSLAGASRALAIGASQRARVIATITKQGTQDGLQGIGLTQLANGGPMTSGAPSSMIFGLNNGTPYFFSTIAGFTSANIAQSDGTGGGTVLPDGIYIATLTVDELNVSFSLTNAAHSIDYFYTFNGFRRASFSTKSFTGIVVWNSGATGILGNSVGPLCASTGGRTASDRSGIEGIGDSVVYGRDIYSNDYRISIPKSYDSAIASPVVFYHHGAGGNANEVWTDAAQRATIQALLDAGYLVISSLSNFGNWGNQLSLDINYLLYQWTRDHYNIGPLLMLGHSMGGMDSTLALADTRFAHIAGWAGIFPVCNLRDMYDLDRFTLPINSAYGIAGSVHDYPAYLVATEGHDPVLLSAAAFRNVPMRFYASYGDSVVPRATNSDRLHDLLIGNTTENTVIPCTGEHGNASHFQPSDLLAFFNRCIGA